MAESNNTIATSIPQIVSFAYKGYCLELKKNKNNAVVSYRQAICLSCNKTISDSEKLTGCINLLKKF